MIRMGALFRYPASQASETMGILENLAGHPA